MSRWIVDIHGEIEGDYELICKAESTVSLDEIKQAREEIQKYEADCLVLEDRPMCLECNENMFKSIYHILDKLMESKDMTAFTLKAIGSEKKSEMIFR